MERPYSLAIALLAGLIPGIASADGPVTTVFFNTGNEIPTPTGCPRAVGVERQMGGHPERIEMPLLDCDRTPREEAVVALSLLARPRTRAAPTPEELEAFDRASHPGYLAEDIRELDPELLVRLQRLGEAFEGHAIQIYSGYRPQSGPTSRHHHARALDLMVEGVESERVRDVASGFDQTGVGWYPNSTFVHIDVRDESHYWVDLSGPGESPLYLAGTSPSIPSREEIEASLEGISIPLP